MQTGKKPPPRVGIVGASGIGRHHAKWWHLEGAEVCAFVGRTPDSVAATAEKLRGLFPFAGTGYTDLATMLESEQPDLVDVCSPPECHAGHVREALLVGCDVLCEKPFVYDARLPPAAWLEQARELVYLAETKGRTLALCTQYTQAARLCRTARGGQSPARAFEAVLRVPARDRAPDLPYIWIDLAPHLFGALQAVIVGAAPQWESLRVEATGDTVVARFEVRTTADTLLPCRLESGFNRIEPGYCRRIVLDGDGFDIGGENGPDGLFRTRLSGAGRADSVHEDTLRLLIREQLAGKSMLPARLALENQIWTTTIWQRIR